MANLDHEAGDGSPSNVGCEHIPMTRPDQVLAVHEQRYGHSVGWVQLHDGTVLMSGGGEFRTSSDLGITWSPPFLGTDNAGNAVSGSALVPLSDNGVGMVSRQDPPKEAGTRYETRLQFRRSADGGKTWSSPVTVNPHGPGATLWQDMLLRTSSGRIILPVYCGLGQGTSHLEGTPHVGGFVNGNFVTTDAHFYDPHFGASFVFYSDDDGTTWHRNRGGELLIVLEQAARLEPTFEPSVTEVSPGKLLMIMRTRLGRYFQAWSDDDGESWSRPQPTQLAGTHAPAQVRKLPGSGHLLCVFTQQSEEEVLKGFVRTRLSSAVSRNGGGLWEHFQNVESIHERTHCEPGPIRVLRPGGGYPMGEIGAVESNPDTVVPLPVGYGRWSYPSVLVLADRVLISHTYSYHDDRGLRQNANGSRLKVLPLSWFYGGRDPYDNPTLSSLSAPPRP